MWKVPANAASGATAVVAQAGEPAQQHVDLDLRALGRRSATPSAPLPPAASSRARTAGPTPLSTRRPRSGLRTLAADRHLAVGGDRGHLGVGAQVGPGLPSRALELGADAAHAADRDVPVAGAAADHVVQEAAVLAQTLVVG